MMSLTPLSSVVIGNVSWFLQQLGTDVYNYQVLLDYQVNKYVAPDGSKPFGKAPDEQRAVCSWKPIVWKEIVCEMSL